MDKLKLRYFSDPDSFGKAMELLMQYEKFENSSWNEIGENFLCKLDEADDLLLEQAIKYQKELNKTSQENSNRIEGVLDFV